MDVIRQQLDELMGKDRNLLVCCCGCDLLVTDHLQPHEKKGRGPHFTDSEVCKNYICGFCPSELFTNTKSDLGM